MNPEQIPHSIEPLFSQDELKNMIRVNKAPEDSKLIEAHLFDVDEDQYVDVCMPHGLRSVYVKVVPSQYAWQ